MKLPEIHNRQPSIPISLRKVGVTGVKMPVGFAFFKRKPVVVMPVFDVFIDLPATQKGIHASRNYEIITEVLSEFAGKTYKLENVCSAIARALLKRHRYAQRSEVKARGTAMVEKTTPKSGRISYEPCLLMASAEAIRKPDGLFTVRRKVGVGIKGITACPCAQAAVKHITKKRLVEQHKLSEKSVRKILRYTPLATHMQRSYGYLMTEVPEDLEIDASKLVNVVEGAMSATSYGLLKKEDEAELITRAVHNPRFVEDCIRQMMARFARNFHELPGFVEATFKQKSLESIHKHDFVAYRTITLGEIRRELEGGKSRVDAKS